MKVTRDDRKGESTQQLLLIAKKVSWTLQFLKVLKVSQAKDVLLKDILLHVMELKQIKPALIHKQG